jgi:hypothetical protein
MGMSVHPLEHDPPLVVDADRMILLQVASQLLETIGGRRQQVLQSSGRIESFKPPLRLTSETGEPSDHLVPEQRFRMPVSERLDHHALYRIPV